MHDFKKLEVWKKAVELAILVYKITASLPKDERYGLIAQMRRCSVSIGSNISEGAGRGSKLEFCRFLDFSYGSTCELYTQSLISRELNFIGQNDFNQILNKNEEVQKMIYTLRKSILAKDQS